jgi:hypothetical protein
MPANADVTSAEGVAQVVEAEWTERDSWEGGPVVLGEGGDFEVAGDDDGRDGAEPAGLR